MSDTDVVGASIRLAEEALAEKQAELDKVAGPLVAEVNKIKAFIKKNTKGSGSGSTSTVSDEDLLAAVGHASKNGPASSKEIAKVLATDTRNIARKLSKLASNGTIQGNKDDGYSV